MIKVEIITDKKDAEYFGDFVTSDDFPYPPEIIIDYAERYIGQSHMLFIKATKNGSIKGVACAQEIELPPAIHVNFLGSRDREATYQMMRTLAVWAKFMKYDRIQHAVHKSVEAWQRLIGGGEVTAYVRSGTPEELERLMEEKLRRMEK